MRSKIGVVTTFGLLFGLPVFAQELVSGEAEKSTVADSVYELESVFVENQYQYLPVAPPSESVFFQSLKTVVAVDWKGFPEKFTKQMYAEMDENGFPLYRVSVYEDASTRQTVFLNMYGKEVFRLDPAKDYDPYAWQKVAFGEESYLVLDELNRWIFDPAHIAVKLVLIPTVFHSDYLALEEESASAESVAVASSPAESETVSVGMDLVPAGEAATLAAESESVAMTMDSSPPPPPDDGSNTNNVSGGGSSNLVVTLTINLPEGFGQMGHIELFFRDNLVYPTNWYSADDWVPTLGSQTVEWIDFASSNKVKCYYYIGDGTDSDGDGHSDLYESWVGNGTDPDVFDADDSDTDGINDWWEEKLFGGLSQDLLDDTDGDGLTNNVEMIVDSMGRIVAMPSDPNFEDSDNDDLEDWPERMTWHTEAMNPDTDGDGLTDGAEINASPRTDPHNDDTGAPTVAFSVN